MDPMTESHSSAEKEVAAFYDALAADYDSMTGFESRFAREKPYFQPLVERFRIKTAIDAGCGSGFHSLLLAQLGVQVTAVDVSPEMLHLVNVHAHELNLRVKTVEATFQELERVIRTKVDAVITLGNSLPHILTAADLKKALRSFWSLLNPGGVLLVQNLNYDRILATRDRIQSTKTSGTKTFVRFYEYDDDGILFHVRTSDRSGDTAVEKVETIRLRPLLRDELVGVLTDIGFTTISVCGSIAMEQFVPATSRDLVLVAQKLASRTEASEAKPT